MTAAQTGTIVSLQVCPGHRKAMRFVESARFVENLGLDGDLHALEDSSRQVLLLEKETLDALGLGPGVVKENITTSGVRLIGLPFGTRMHLGREVELEITKYCTPCHRMDEIRPGLLSEIAGKRGMLARVVTGGEVRRGDAITVGLP